MKILVVDDEKLLVKGIKFNLENEGYTVDACYDGESAVNMARTGGYDLIILDLMMPKKDGLEACQEIRGFSTVPIIMLTARSEDADMLMGFESGADDYVTKPFNILALKARVRALLRRASMSAAQEPAKTSVLTRGHISVDTERRSAYKNGVAIELTMKEFDLIEFLMKNPGGCTAARICSTSSGATIIRATRAPWTCTSVACAKSWSLTPRIRSTSSRSGASDITSPTEDSLCTA